MIMTDKMYEPLMTKPDFFAYAAVTDQLLCFRYVDSIIHLLLKSVALFCGSTARFVSDLVGNPGRHVFS